MRSLEIVLSDIEKLTLPDLEIILNRILQRLRGTNEVSNLLQEYQGIGKSIWTDDAQDYVNNMREDDSI